MTENAQFVEQAYSDWELGNNEDFKKEGIEKEMGQKLHLFFVVLGEWANR
ncbi:hypothetical protein ACQ4XT_13815 [Halobacillus faecis]